MQLHHQFFQGSDQLPRASYSGQTYPKASLILPGRSHMLSQCCRETHHFVSTMMHSRSPNLPIHCNLPLSNSWGLRYNKRFWTLCPFCVPLRWSSTRGRRFSIVDVYWESVRLVLLTETTQVNMNLLNFVPCIIRKVTTLCFHKVTNHLPICVRFHNKLGQRFQSRIEQFFLSLSHFDHHGFSYQCRTFLRRGQDCQFFRQPS